MHCGLGQMSARADRFLEWRANKAMFLALKIKRSAPRHANLRKVSHDFTYKHSQLVDLSLVRMPGRLEDEMKR